MIIHLCDICKKPIGHRQGAVSAGMGWGGSTLCATCGKPIINFLKKHQLVDADDLKEMALAATENKNITLPKASHKQRIRRK